jgi:VRR-NUC domain
VLSGKQKAQRKKQNPMTQQGTLVFERSETSTGRTRRRRPRYVETSKEADVLAGCLEYLSLRNIPHWRANSGAAHLQHRDGTSRFVRFGVRGQSDILGILPGSGGGKLLAVECKAPRGRLSPDQAAFLEMVNGAGGLGIVVRSVEELAAALKRFTRGAE